MATPSDQPLLSGPTLSPEVISDAPLCARSTPSGVVEGPEVCQTTPEPTVAPMPMTGRPPLPPLLPSTGAGGGGAVTRTRWLVAGIILAAVVWYGRRQW